MASKMPLNQIHPLLSVFIICYLYESKEDDLCFGNRLTPKCQCLHTSKIYLTTTEHKSSFHPPPWACHLALRLSKVTTAREEKDKDSSPPPLPRSNTQQSAQMPLASTVTWGNYLQEAHWKTHRSNYTFGQYQVLHPINLDRRTISGLDPQ